MQAFCGRPSPTATNIKAQGVVSVAIGTLGVHEFNSVAECDE